MCYFLLVWFILFCGGSLLLLVAVNHLSSDVMIGYRPVNSKNSLAIWGGGFHNITQWICRILWHLLQTSNFVQGGISDC